MYDETTEEVECRPSTETDQRTIYFGVPDRVFPMTCEYIDRCTLAEPNVKLTSIYVFDAFGDIEFQFFLYL